MEKKIDLKTENGEIIKLKAMAYDKLVTLDRVQRELAAINQRIQQVLEEPKPEKEKIVGEQDIK